MYKTHIIGGIFLYLLLALIFGIGKEFYLLLAVAIGTLLPDIDSSKSWINNLFKPGKIVAAASKHRGFWHSIFGLLAIFLLTAFVFAALKISAAMAFYVAFGALTHLLFDALTVTGIKPLWRFSSFELRWKIKTNGILEYVLFFILLLSSIYLYSPQFVANVTSYVIKLFK